MEFVPISELFSMEKGVLQSSKCTPGEYPFITAADEWKTHTDYSHEQEALLFAAAASGSLGRVHYVNGKFISSDLCYILAPKDPRNRPLDLRLYQFIFQQYKEDIVRATKAGTSKESISQGALGAYRLPYLPLPKQKEALKKLLRVSEKKATVTTELDHQRALLKQLRQAILQEAVQGKLTAAWRTKEDKPVTTSPAQLETLRKQLQEGQAQARGQKSFKYKPSVRISLGGKTKGIEKLDPLPEGWQWVSLGQICWNVSDGPHFSPRYVLDGVHMVSGRNITLEKGIDFDTAKYVSRPDYLEFIKRGKPEVGDVLLTKGGTTGIPAVVETNDEFCVWVHVAIIKVLREVVDPYYLKWALASPLVYRQSQEQTHGIGNQDLGLTRMVYFAIPLPPLVEQRVIARRVAQLMKQTIELDDSLDASGLVTTTLLQSVLSEVMGGGAKYGEVEGGLSLAAEA